MALSMTAELLKKELDKANELEHISPQQIEYWTEQLVNLGCHDLSLEEVGLRNDIYNQLWQLASKHDLDLVLTHEDWVLLNEMGVYRTWARYLEEMAQVVRENIEDLSQVGTIEIDEADIDTQAENISPIQLVLPKQTVMLFEDALTTVSHAHYQMILCFKHVSEDDLNQFNASMDELQNMFKDPVPNYSRLRQLLDEYLQQEEALFKQEDKIFPIAYYQKKEHVYQVIQNMLSYITYFFTLGHFSDKNFLAEKSIKRTYFFQLSTSESQELTSRKQLQALLVELKTQIDKLKKDLEDISPKHDPLR